MRMLLAKGVSDTAFTSERDHAGDIDVHVHRRREPSRSREGYGFRLPTGSASAQTSV